MATPNSDTLTSERPLLEKIRRLQRVVLRRMVDQTARGQLQTVALTPQLIGSGRWRGGRRLGDLKPPPDPAVNVPSRDGSSPDQPNVRGRYFRNPLMRVVSELKRSFSATSRASTRRCTGVSAATVSGRNSAF